MVNIVQQTLELYYDYVIESVQTLNASVQIEKTTRFTQIFSYNLNVTQIVNGANE